MEPHLLAALGLGVASVVALVLWSRIDAFGALLVGALVTGLVAGVPVGKLIEHITGGFGDALGSIGIIIALGVMIGKILEESGGAHALARLFVRIAGKGREDIALTMTGAVVSVPVYADSGYVILHPLARSIAQKYGRPLTTMSLALAGGLVLTHHIVAPTPGPLAAAGMLGADLGAVILAGLLFILPLIPVVLIYARTVGARLASSVDHTLVPGMRDDAVAERDHATAEHAVTGDGAKSSEGHQSGDGRTIGDGHRSDDGQEESGGIGVFRASFPLLLPLLLIVGNTFTDALVPETGLATAFGAVGEPAIALLIGLVLAVYLLPRRGTGRTTVLNWLTAAAASAGMIVFIIGAGGAFGEVLQQSGVGDALAEMVAGWPLPLFLAPYMISAFMRTAQGSATVAIITAATLSAPLVETSGLDPTLAVLSACAGSFVFSYVNDSFFWVIARFTGLSAGAAMRIWPGMTLVLGGASLPLLGLSSLVLG